MGIRSWVVERQFVGASAIALALQFGTSFLVKQAVETTANMQVTNLLVVEEYLRALPWLLPLHAISAIAASVSSAGLFQLAFAEARGKPVLLRDMFLPLFRPVPLLLFGLASTLSHLGIWLVVMQDPTWKSFWFVPHLLLSPFAALVLPFFVEGSSVTEASQRGIISGFRQYFRLFGGVVSGTVRSYIGVLFFGIGLLWTYPNYQREIVQRYLAMHPDPEPAIDQAPEV